MPKFDLVARRDDYSNYQNGGSRDENRVELRMNYNLFNGGSDAARSRQFRERKNVTLDQREKVCRDVRQTLAIAFNETLRLNDQLSFIGVQVSLLEKTRAAYRDQFNIGQRTLLDLLNTQNEYFDARRTQVNADVDLSIAYLRSYVGMGRLLETLGLKRIDADNNPDESDLTPVDVAQMCPPITPIDTTLDREALGRRAKEMMEASSSSFIGNRPQPVVGAPLATLPAAAAQTLEPAPANQPSAPLSTELANRTAAWGAAWAARNVSGYLDFYSPQFKPEGGVSRDNWARQREQRLSKAGAIRIEIRDLAVRSTGPDTAVAEFKQIYTADSFGDTSLKTLEWRKENGQWLIVRESVRAVAKGQ